MAQWEWLRERLEAELWDDVVVWVAGEDPAAPAWLEEMATLHPALRVIRAARVPGAEPPWAWFPRARVEYALAYPEEEPRVRFVGRPQGMELDLLVEEILAFSRHRRLLDPAAADAARAWQGPHRLAVLTTPDCPQCSRTVRTAHALAREAAETVAWEVDLDAHPDLLRRLDIRGVPVTFADDLRRDGPVPEWILAQLVAGLDRPVRS
ncbi:protein of unknown function [Candidatus Hydrogenisulfobacillus filiaventi]|uniref:Glutaredoxin n=1 Tax=Candidatus Hydrogenisulfobacillus filiaventi TaxID=2707344 RepID=A0A6F8ZFM2_9FIRM|nr:hypothetical protein [Bacillota bacterium]CAB1128789.1 protein of unknown function [Candidatus Hydrogenisulfobacillus filiaventi]